MRRTEEMRRPEEMRRSEVRSTHNLESLRREVGVHNLHRCIFNKKRLHYTKTSQPPMTTFYDKMEVITPSMNLPVKILLKEPLDIAAFYFNANAGAGHNGAHALQINLNDTQGSRRLFDYAYEHSVLGTGIAPDDNQQHGNGWCTVNTVADVNKAPSGGAGIPANKFCVNYQGQASYQNNIVGCTQGHTSAEQICNIDYLRTLGAKQVVTDKSGQTSLHELPACDLSKPSKTQQKYVIGCDKKSSHPHLCSAFDGKTISMHKQAAEEYNWSLILDPGAMTVADVMRLKWRKDQGDDECDAGQVAILNPDSQLDKCTCRASDKQLDALTCKDTWNQPATCCRLMDQSGKTIGTGHSATDCATLKSRASTGQQYEEAACRLCADDEWQLPLDVCQKFKPHEFGTWDNYGQSQKCVNG